ncbi:MAG: ABC transporter ATP-binding protein [Lachnospiraceae bacterium]|nr:ABC transporter ATP-binding protein [Lachnospiraceae bacterium]
MQKEAPPAIEVRDLCKVYKLYNKPSDRLKDALIPMKKKLYKEHYALSHVDLSVRQGEAVGIIGTNGSGKSTILKIITGVLSKTSGEVNVNGRISALLELGAGFNMEYTGIENIYLNGTMIGFSQEEIDNRLEDILEFADIGDFVYQPVKTYSSGMFVRLAFAVAINIDPEILIVDEALSVGDVFFQMKCFHKFEEFKAMGKTILFVSHDLSSIAKYCDRVILLNQGVKLAEGLPKDMINMYKKLLVNQLDVETLEDVSGRSRVTGTEATGGWRDQFTVNAEVLDYGEKQAEIVDFAIVDQYGAMSNIIQKGSRFSVKAKLIFHETVKDPIFTFTIKNAQGTDITGTNTMFERVETGTVRAGEERIVTYTQQMDLQGGEYLISLGCTGYQGDEFKVYHRLYDLVSLSVISDKNTVGFFDMNTIITVEKVGESESDGSNKQGRESESDGQNKTSGERIGRTE